MSLKGEYDAELLLAIPCFRENERLPPFLDDLSREVEKLDFSVIIQVVDDGSPKDEQTRFLDAIHSFRATHPIVAKPLAYRENRGKGHAIRTAWNHQSARFLAFVDADGSIAAADACQAVTRIREPGAEKSLYIATRSGTDGSRVKRMPSRHVASRAFNSLLRWRYGIQCKDTQCGLKIVPSRFYEKQKPRFRQNGYAFDIELIQLAREEGLNIEEIPVSWEEKPGGKLGLGDGVALFWDILRKRI